SNPSSADAIRMTENRLVKRAERRQAMFGKAWTEVARLILMVRDGRSFAVLTDEELAIRPMWRDAATPTRAAAADEVVKMIAAGVYTAQGDYALKRLGLSPMDREMLRRDRAADTQGVLARLEASLSQPNPAADALASTGDTMGAGESGGVESAQELKAKADAMGVLIRAGVKPDSAASQVGLAGLDFWEGRPVTLKYNDEA